MYIQQADIAAPQRVKELLSLLEDEPFCVVSQHGLLETGDYRAVTGCFDSTMCQTETNWSDTTSYRPEPRGQESSWPTLQEICACSPTRPILLGPSNSGRKFYEGNSSREFVPRHSSFGCCERCLEPSTKPCALQINRRR